MQQHPTASHPNPVEIAMTTFNPIPDNVLWEPTVDNREWERQQCEQLAGEEFLEVGDPGDATAKPAMYGRHTVGVCLLARSEVIDGRKAYGPQIAVWLRGEARRLLRMADALDYRKPKPADVLELAAAS
jgi:hypothetical protein